jgi:hypothetical protein
MGLHWEFVKSNDRFIEAYVLLCRLSNGKTYWETFYPKNYGSDFELRKDVIDSIEYLTKKLNKKWWQFWI